MSPSARSADGETGLVRLVWNSAIRLLLLVLVVMFVVGGVAMTVVEVVRVPVVGHLLVAASLSVLMLGMLFVRLMRRRVHMAYASFGARSLPGVP